MYAVLSCGSTLGPCNNALTDTPPRKRHNFSWFLNNYSNRVVVGANHNMVSEAANALQLACDLVTMPEANE